MLKDKIVRIRTKRMYPGQNKWSYVGKVVAFTESWVMIKGKGLLVLKGQTRTVDMDPDLKHFAIPRDNISDVHVLPDTFDMDHIELSFDGVKIGLKVEGAPDTWIGEAGD